MSRKIVYTFVVDTEKKVLNTAFSQNLKRFRKRKGYTQYDLADLTGFSQRMIAYYENHTAHPSLDRIEVIARVLGVKPSDLLSTKEFADDEIDASKFDSRSLKKLQEILSLPPNDRSMVYRMVNKLVRENNMKMKSSDHVAVKSPAYSDKQE